MLIRCLFLLNLFFINSCNVASVLTGAETELGSNFGLDVEKDLIHFWKLDENSSTPRDDDKGGLTLIDQAGVSRIAGKRSGAADCNSGAAADGFLETNSASTFLDYNNFEYTFSFWINPQTGTPADDYYVLWYGSTMIYLRYLAGPSMDLYFQFGSGVFSVTSILGSSEFNTWTHFSIAVDGSAARAYVYKNGNFYSEEVITTSAHSNGVLTLCSVDDGTSKFQGSIDSVGIWERRLDDKEIKALYSGNNNVD